MLPATTRRGFSARRPSVTVPALGRPVLDVLTIIVLGTGVYLWLPLAAPAQGRRQRRSCHRARLRGRCSPHVVLMVCREKSSNAWTAFCCPDRRRRVEHRRPCCGASRRWMVGCRVVALADLIGSAVSVVRHVAKARSARLDRNLVMAAYAAPPFSARRIMSASWDLR
jgi:hypothetical protein